MKVLFLTASTSRNAGGLFFTITSLTKELKIKGVEVEVFGICDEFSNEDKSAYGSVPVRNYNVVPLPLLSSLGYSLDLDKMLERFAPDIIHVQGIWMYHSLATLRYKRKHPSVKVIIEPHGMLDPWAVCNSAWKKKIVGHWFEYENLRSADCIHALCKSEYDSIRKFGLNNPIAILPNGVELPKTAIKFDSKEKNILFLGRIHPKKGLVQLIEGIGIIRNQLNGWKFRIAGWDQNGHQEMLSNIVRQNSLENYISFIGPVFGEKKITELQNARAFILPSFSEGLPMSVLEAWSYGLPSLMTEQCNLPEGFAANAAIKIDTTPESIANGIIKFISLSDLQVNLMAQNSINLVKRQFSWSTIADDTIKLYKYLCNEDKDSNIKLTNLYEDEKVK